MEAVRDIMTPPLGLVGQEHFQLSHQAHLLPIEFFKEGAQFFRPDQIDHAAGGVVFHSSGTTGGGRSLSMFSAEGVERYREASITMFGLVLAELCRRPLDVPIISFIPKIATAPNSSLARMIDFFSRRWNVTYTTPEACAAAVSAAKKPLCLFGTTAHFIALANRPPIRLPTGSVVIETGGLKTLNESFDRVSLHRRITASLGVPSERIVSEYGMAELASQAYDWVRPDQVGPRRFRFPPWVSIWVTRGLGHLERRGTGALVILDRARVDIPWPIRTQDLALLQSGSFSYRGRVPQAVLKGCALDQSLFRTTNEA